jgi:hypothetical protein
MPTDPMSQFIQLVATARASRVRREVEAQNSTADGKAPAETPFQETRHGKY